MKITKLLTGILFLFLTPVFSFAQNKLCRVKLFTPGDHSRNELLGLLAIDHFITTSDGSIEAEISQTDLQLLKKTSYKYTLLIPDVTKRLDSFNRIYYNSISAAGEGQRVAIQQPGSNINSIITTPINFEVKPTFAGYYTFAEMEAAIDLLVAQYPTIASKESIGKTNGNRDLWVVKISDNVGVDETEPEAFFMGLQHAREAITGASMIFFMQYLCEQYSSNTKIKDLVDNREIFIMPCFNPDGWEYNFTSTSGNGGGSWRKNRSPNGDGTFGKDLNRNWGVDWGNCSSPILGDPNSCGTSATSADTYYGPSAFSELETQALRVFAKTHHFVTAFDQHAFGPYYSIPFGRKSLHNTAATDMSTKDSNFYKAIPALMGTYNGMRAADSYDALGYEVAGGFKDWMLTGEVGVGTKDSVWGMTGEGGAGGGNSAFGSMASFWAPASEIINLCKGMTYQNLQLAYAAGSYADVQDALDIALTSKTGNLSFNLRRIGLTNGSITVSIIPVENIASVGSPAVISSMTYYQTYTGNISYTLPAALTNGQRVRFVWQVQTGGITYSDTITKFYNPTQLFFDNMEGTLGTNWTSSSGSGSSGYGYNYTNGSWVFTTGGYNATKALSESVAGTNYTTRTRSIIKCNTIFNLSDATAAYLSFWTRHQAENFRDKLQVQVSVDGTSWTPINGNTTVKEPGILDGATLNGQPALTGIQDTWMQEQFDLDAYRSNATVYFRFVFTSDNDPSTFKYELDDGFYIDDVKLIKSTAALVSLPVNFISFTGVLLPNKTIELAWNAMLNSDHNYFDVQRSVDGNNFQTIGQISKGAAQKFIDAQPLYGNNYYRIRQVDKDGQFMFSKTIVVALKPEYTITVYPNPVSKILSIRLQSDNSSKVTLQVTDGVGRQMNHQEVGVNTTQEVNIDVSGWAAQLYLIKITGMHSEVLQVQKFLKR